MNPGPPSKRRRTKEQGELWDDGEDFSAEALENIDNLIASSQAPCKPSPVPRLVGRGTHRSHSAGEMGHPLQLRESPAVPRVVRHPIIQPSRFASQASDSERQLQEKCSSLSRQMRDLQQSRDGQVTMLKNNVHEREQEIARLRQESAALAQTHSKQEDSLERKCSSLATQIDFKDQELQDAHSRRLQLQRQLQQCQKEPNTKVTSSPAKSNFPSTQSFMAQENSPQKTITGAIGCQTSPLKNSQQLQPQAKRRSRRCALRLKPADESPSLLQCLLQAPSSGLQSLLSNITDVPEGGLLQHSSNDSLLSRLMPRIKAHLQSHVTSSQGETSTDANVTCALHTLKILLEHSEHARQLLLTDDPSFLHLLRDLSFPERDVSLSAITAAFVLAKHSPVDNLQSFDCFLDRLPEAVFSDGTETSVTTTFLSLLSTLTQSDSIRSLICSANKECLLRSLALFVRSKEAAISLKFIEILSSFMSSTPSGLQSLSNNTCPCAAALLPSLIIIMHNELPSAHTDASWAVLSRGFSLLHAQSLCHPHFIALHSLVEGKYVQLICGMERILKARQVDDELTVNALHELWDFEQDIPADDEDAENRSMQH